MQYPRVVVVLLRRVQFGVIHELTEDVDRDTGVGVALGVAVPVGVGHDAPPVELDTVGGAQFWDGVDPRAVVEADAESGDRPAAVGVTSVSGQQLQLADRCVGVAARTRCCWLMTSVAVASLIDNRRSSRLALRLL